MIYVLMKEDMYIAGAIGTLRVNRNNPFDQPRRVPGTKVKFQVTKNINQAKLVEDPDMDAVKKYGLTAIEVRIDKPQLEIVGVTYED